MHLPIRLRHIPDFVGGLDVNLDAQVACGYLPHRITHRRDTVGNAARQEPGQAHSSHHGNNADPKDHIYRVAVGALGAGKGGFHLLLYLMGQLGQLQLQLLLFGGG